MGSFLSNIRCFYDNKKQLLIEIVLRKTPGIHVRIVLECISEIEELTSSW